ncbi:hypothetical protein HON52_01800 [Candidatus Uhrbacteria bacterium]|nr:hypothetical protein [Candidatus Uhrbacteria bacterium]
MKVLRYLIASILTGLVITTCGVLILGSVWKAWYVYLVLFLLPGMPNPANLMAWPWSAGITHSMRWLLKINLVVKNHTDLPRGRPVVLICNHPPAAFFPILVWASMTNLRLLPVVVSKASNLWNALLAIVIFPSLVMKALMVTTRGNGWGAWLVEKLSRLMVTRWSMLIIFADAHRPESKKALADYERMVEVVPSIQYQDRLGAYHYAGVYSALKALGLNASVVAATMSFPRGATGWKAPWRVYGETIAIRIRDVTHIFQSAMLEEVGEGGRPTKFIEAINDLACDEDSWIITRNR